VNHLVSAYGAADSSSSSSSSENEQSTSDVKASDAGATAVNAHSISSVAVDLAPPVHGVGRPSGPVVLSSHALAMRANVRADVLAEREATVLHALHRDVLVPGVKNTLTGFVDEHAMSAYQFDATFERERRRRGRDDAALDSALAEHAAAVKARQKTEKRARGDISGAWWGSWAPPDDADDAEHGGNDDDDGGGGGGVGTEASLPLTDAQAAAIDAKNESRKKARVAEAKSKAAATTGERSVFHGKALTDYQGRTYIWPPSDLKPSEHKCYMPKKLAHTLPGHTKGVNRVRYFPTYGHLLLSASMDATIKVWDLRREHERVCLRTMYGHAQAVREVAFNGDGKTFLSCGYDKLVRHWDTETGQCVARLGGTVMSYCAQYYPVNENLVLTGGGDYNITQWDVRANAIVQTYTEHQGAVNTVTFFDESRRFMTTSDDKKIFLWEFGIPVVIKHISDPEMHASPTVAVHPSGQYVACQNLNNTITVYECSDGTMRSKNKVFKGHVTAGYACDVAFSPDGQYIVSGDGGGVCVFWDWKKTTLYSKLKCHDGVAISCQWSPTEPSQFATAGWDGAIKIWN